VAGEIALTVALKVTAWPEVKGLADEAKKVLVDAWLTTCCTEGEVLPAWLVSPP
jgi:hypothetical protein